MNLSLLKLSLCISLLAHGVIVSVVSLVGSGTGGFVPHVSPGDGRTVELVVIPEEPIVVFDKRSIVANEPLARMPGVPLPANAASASELSRFALEIPQVVSVTGIRPLKIDPQAFAVVPEVEVLPIMPSGASASTGPDAANGESLSAQPRYLSNPSPKYPSEARKRKQEGRVLLSMIVTAEGRPAQVELKEGSGFPLLDEAALVEAGKWRFVPARMG
jgi:TonB family protein